MKQKIYWSVAPTVLLLLLLSQAVAAQDLKHDTAYRFGVAYYLGVSNIDSAIICAKQLDDNNPDNEKNTLLGILYEKKGDTTTANSYLGAARTQKAASPSRLHWNLAMVRWHRGDTTGAIAYMNMSIQEDGTKPKRLFLLGKLYSYQGNADSATANYQRAHALDQANASYSQATYAGYHQKGMFRESMPYLNSFAGTDTVSVANMLSLAADRMELDSFASALSVLRRVIRIDPLDSTGYYYKGLCELELGDTANGLCSLRQSIHLAKMPAQAVYDLLVASYEARERHYEMKETIQRGAKNGLLSYITWLANAELAKREIRRIDSQFRTDNSADQLNDLASLASLTSIERNDRKTLRLLGMYMARVQTVPDSLYLLKARSELNLNRLAEAKADVETALGIAPSDSIGQALQVSILFKMKNYKDAVAALLPMTSTVISTNDRAALLFKAYTLLGDTADALKYYQGGQ